MISKGEQLLLEREARDRSAKRRSADKEEECYYSVINQVFLRGREMLFLRGTAANTVASYRTQEYDAWGATRRQPFLLSNTVANAVESLALHVHRERHTFPIPVFSNNRFASPLEYNVFAVSCNRSNLKSKARDDIAGRNKEMD